MYTNQPTDLCSPEKLKKINETVVIAFTVLLIIGTAVTFAITNPSLLTR